MVMDTGGWGGGEGAEEEVEWVVMGYGFEEGQRGYVATGDGKRRRLASDEMRECYGERFDP